MAQDDYGIIWNIDFSTTVISQMKDKHKNNPKLKYIVANVTKKISFEDNTFDLIICKATMDAILTSSPHIGKKAFTQLS